MDNALIKIKDITKDFKLPHMKTTTLRGSFLSLLKKKTYTEFRALDEVSFEINEGDFFGIIGRNGSGKSTLLKIIANIYLPDKGNVTVKGNISPFLELGVGFNDELTARENVYLNGSVLGLTKKEIRDSFDEIIRFAELEEFVDQKFKNFSSGMRARLGFSLAIKAHADIILIDEVLAVGDSNFQKKCFDVFRGFKEEGKTIVFVTHSMGSIKDFCNRVALLDHGKLVTVTDPETAAVEYERLNLERNNMTKGEKAKVGKGKLEITNVKFLNGAKKDKVIFNSGEKINVQISYQNNTKMDSAHFGVGLYTSDGAHFSTLNTFYDGPPVILKKKGVVVLELDMKNCLSRDYYVNVAIFDAVNVGITHHLVVQKYGFGLRNKKQGAGILLLKHKWKTDGR